MCIANCIYRSDRPGGPHFANGKTPLFSEWMLLPGHYITSPSFPFLWLLSSSCDSEAQSALWFPCNSWMDSIPSSQHFLSGWPFPIAKELPALTNSIVPREDSLANAPPARPMCSLLSLLICSYLTVRSFSSLLVAVCESSCTLWLCQSSASTK